jgi:dTDP-4-amino-4,6-dideoxygalactose transaminase
MSQTIPFWLPEVGPAEVARLEAVIASNYLNEGQVTAEFEQALARLLHVKHVVSATSGTGALFLTLAGCGIGPGDEVLVPTMTFTASAEVVRYLGAEPMLLDVEYGSCLLTPAIADDALQRHPRAKALVVVHYGGQAAAMDGGKDGGILGVCRRRGVRVVEDAAHAFPARWAGRTIGSLGDVTCFSFYANKTITTGEGGMLTTHDEAIARRAKMMRLHGIDRDAWNRYTSGKVSWEYDVVSPGFKYNMPDVNAAIGVAQLERAGALRAERERCARFYLHALAGHPALDLPRLHVPVEDHAWHLFHVILHREAPVSRARFIEALVERGIGTSVHYKPLHRMMYYRKRYHLDSAQFPEAEKIWQGCVSLPIYPSLSDAELSAVVEAVCDILK